jgi:HlyD family secretion protein
MRSAVGSTASGEARGWSRAVRVAATGGLAALLAACAEAPPADRVRVSGYVEATDVRVAAEVGGRLLDLKVNSGDRVQQGEPIARLDTADTELAIRRAQAERRQAEAQLRLLQAGARPEDIRQAQAQVQAAEADLAAAGAEVAAAGRDLERFEALLRASSGSRKQRDDAATRLETATARAAAAAEGVHAVRQALARLRAGARREEIDAARARVAAMDAQLAVFEKALADAVVRAPVAGTITQKLVDAGELLPPRSPIVVITDLDRAWANLYVDEPLVPRLRLGQAAVVRTDAGDAIEGTVTFISPRAEFTPRNVQTAEERSKLVYRIKVSVDNRAGILKQGMPVEADVPLAPAGEPAGGPGGA